MCEVSGCDTGTMPQLWAGGLLLIWSCAHNWQWQAGCVLCVCGLLTLWVSGLCLISAVQQYYCIYTSLDIITRTKSTALDTTINTLNLITAIHAPAMLKSSGPRSLPWKQPFMASCFIMVNEISDELSWPNDTALVALNYLQSNYWWKFLVLVDNCLSYRAVIQHLTLKLNYSCCECMQQNY